MYLYPFAEDETSDRKKPYRQDDTHVSLQFRNKSDFRTATPQTILDHSGSEDEGVSGTDPRIWGRLLAVDETKWAGIVLADRREDFPASKPQGYLVGRDSECGESYSCHLSKCTHKTVLINVCAKIWSSNTHMYRIATA